MKVVINRREGGFGLSQEGMEFLGLDWDGFDSCYDLSRNDPKLVQCVESLGVRADGRYAQLGVVVIPDGIEYFIQEHHGREWIAEVHRVWD